MVSPIPRKRAYQPTCISGSATVIQIVAVARGGGGEEENANHKDLEVFKGASAFAFHSSGGAFFEVFWVFPVCFSCQCLNRRVLQLVN